MSLWFGSKVKKLSFFNKTGPTANIYDKFIEVASVVGGYLKV